jgi:hypothetical protein
MSHSLVREGYSIIGAFQGDLGGVSDGKVPRYGFKSEENFVLGKVLVRFP